MKLKKGDDIKVIRGKDKGKTGKVEKVMTKADMVIVPGVNLYKRHLKARSQNEKSEIKTVTKPLPISNVRLICPKCKLPTRVGFKVTNGKKERICRKCKAII